MGNMNNQGKRPEQYTDSMRNFSRAILGIIILMILMVLLSGCYGTYYITDAEYDNVREEHLAITYHNNSIYWGWNNGFYYYYNTCTPSYYNTTTHIIINKPVIKPTHRPNRPIVKPTHRPNVNIKTNVNRNKVNIKTNKSHNSNKRSTNTRRRPK